MIRKTFALALLAALAGSANADVFGTWDSSVTATHYGGVAFNVTASGGKDILLTGGFNLNLDLPDATDATENIEVYYRAGSYVGNVASNAGWTLLGSDVVDVLGTGVKSSANVGASLLIPKGETYALAIFARDGGLTGIGYTNPATAGAPGAAPTTSFSNSDLTLSLGIVKGFGSATNAFSSHTISGQRVWRGELEYQPVPEPASMAALALGAVALLRRRKKA